MFIITNPPNDNQDCSNHVPILTLNALFDFLLFFSLT